MALESRNPPLEGMVSVVLPYRDRADVLGRAIISVMRQTYVDWELILVDDQSSDGSAEVAKSFADPRIRLTRTVGPPGASRARNVGIDLARGRYLAFQDSDDEWLPEKLERQLGVLRDSHGESRDVAAVGCRRVLTRGGRDPEWVGGVTIHSAAQVLAGCAPGTGTPALLLDRALTDSSARFSPEMPCYEERDFLYQALAGRSVAVLQESLLRVERGRSDHVSNGLSALVGLEFMISRYSVELRRRPGLLEWYHYAAMREALRGGAIPAARRHRSAARMPQRLGVWSEYWLGRWLGDVGLSLAARSGIRRDAPWRCAPSGRLDKG